MKQLVRLDFLAPGWSRIAMQWCSAVLILFPFLLPTSLPPPSFPSRGCGESNMRGNEKEAHLFLTGAAVQPQCPLFLPSLLTYSMHLFLCQSALSLFRPHLFHLFVSPSTVASSIFIPSSHPIFF